MNTKYLSIRYILTLAFSSLLFSCSVMDDIHNELDEIAPQPNETYNYTLVAADYAAIGKTAMKDAVTATDSALVNSISSRNALPQGFAVKYVPDFLATQHPSLMAGSVCKLTYDTQDSLKTNLDQYAKAKIYTLTDVDYALGNSFVSTNKYFTPANTLVSAADKILKAALPTATTADIVLVKYKQADIDVAGTTAYTAGEYYSFDGAKWAKVNGVYYLSDKDYLTMGQTYKNFDNTNISYNYLPTFLLNKYPYAKAETKTIVVFTHRYNGLQGEEYILNQNVWNYQAPILITTETNQFIRTSEAWFFDPTIRLAMAKPDYQIIVDALKLDADKSQYIDRGNSEFYYGASAHYGNYDLRVSKRTVGDYAQKAFTDLATEADRVALTYKRLEESIGVFLKNKYPDAVTQTNGIDVFYEISAMVYENDLSNRLHTITYQCTKSAPNPEFTFVKRSVK